MTTTSYTTILSLPVVTQITGQESVWLVQGGVDRRATVAQMMSGSIGATVLFADGSASSPSISFINSQHAGFYLIGTNNIGASVNSTKVIDISSSAISFTPNVVPGTNDGAALGTTALQWSDLFLASGGVINWNNGNVTLTQASNALTLASTASGAFAPELILQNTNSSSDVSLKLYHNTTAGWRYRVGASTANTLLWDYTTDNSSFTNFMSLSSAGQLSVLATTQATTTSDGALYTAGGLSVVKNAVIGGTLGVGTGANSTYQIDLLGGSAATRIRAAATGDFGSGFWITNGNAVWSIQNYPTSTGNGGNLAFTDESVGAALLLIKTSLGAKFFGGVQVGSPTGGDKGAGTINMAAALYNAGNQVVGARDTGWTAMTGSSDKATSYDTSTVTLAQLAGRVMAIQAALTTHGLLGA